MENCNKTFDIMSHSHALLEWGNTTNNARLHVQFEEAARGKILTCAGVGLGGRCPSWPADLAGPFEPTGLGCAHVSSCDPSDPQGPCPSVGTE